MERSKRYPLAVTTLPDFRSYISIGVVEHGGGVAFETDLQPEQYAYRPGRSTNDAVKRVHGLLNGGHDEVVDGDLSNYLEVSSYCPRFTQIDRTGLADRLRS